MKKGVLLVISGPSGSGKGTILDIIKKDKNISVAVSATTRKPRSGEIDGSINRFDSLGEHSELLVFILGVRDHIRAIDSCKWLII